MEKYSTYIILLIFSCVLLVVIFFFLHLVPFFVFLLSVCFCVAIAAFLISRNAERENYVLLAHQEQEEKSNIVRNEIDKGSKTKIALQEKIQRYQSLKQILAEVNQNLSLEFVVDSLSSLAFSMIAHNKGACIVYLIDEVTHNPSLYKTKKEDKKLVIKEKEGDMFDFWVLRHASALLIEDIRNDFRFDLEKMKFVKERSLGSLISAPLMSAHRCIGILRIDNPETRAFTQEDLRFLTAVCDVGAVALENGQLYLKAEDLAIHDGLTGLYRKGYFLERLREECKRSIRQNKAFSLLMLDIDFFKKYNDTLGHIAGDIVLKEMSASMLDFCKDESVMISRFGGEEFCIILFGANKEKALTLAEGLRKRIKDTKILLRKQESSVTVSMGVASFPHDARDETELLMKADKAMYEAKQSGRDRVVAV